MRILSCAEALREALASEMERDKTVFLVGEDIGVYGGAFGVTRGLFEKFGPERVMDAPLSELGFVGAAVGAALAGSRPIVEIMFMDFVTLAMDQLVNQAAKLRYVYGPQARCPMVLRAVSGAGRSYGPTHSQSFEAWFLHTPGLKIAAPSTPADHAGLLKSAVRDGNPVIFIEHKMLYSQKDEVPEDLPAVELGRALVTRPGNDLTIVAWSWMAHQALIAAQSLAAEGISAEVVDLRCLCPMDMETVLSSVRKTHRVMVVEEGCLTGGVAAEIACRVMERAFEYLDSPVRRVATPDIPIPCSAALERAAIPGVERICESARSMAKV